MQEVYDPIRHARLLSAMRQTGLTARAIRYYEELGLIVAGRDQHNYRFFDRQTVGRLQTIAELRSAGLALEDIRRILEGEVGEASPADYAVRKLQDRLAELEAERQAVEKALKDVMAGSRPHRRQGRREDPRIDLS